MAKSTDYSNLAIPSTPAPGFLGAGTALVPGMHITSRGLIGAGYVTLGVAVGIVGLVLVIGGVKETQALVKGLAMVA